MVLIPASLAVLILFVPSWIPRTVLAKTEPQVDAKALAKQAEALTKKITSQRQAIDKEKFPEAEKLLAQIEKKAEDLAKAPPTQKDRLMVEMNKLTDALKERQKQLGSPDQVNRQLQQLKAMGQNGPADQFAKELAKGDFKKAAEQLKQLQEKMQKGEMTQAEKKALQEQLAEMSKKLEALANMEQRKKQLDEALKNGGLSKEQYEREMEKLKQQSKSLQQLRGNRQQARPGPGGPQEGRHQESRRVAGHDPAAAFPDGQAARRDGLARQRHGRRSGRQERHERRRHEPARPDDGRHGQHEMV